ncbi:MAG: hypothetical protein U5R46_08380 [Gammaproteobacteria bacterium]|nr:hypothetical protein [Gammaproteobacteria bacterium]
MGKLLRAHAVDQFSKILRVPDSAISPEILTSVRQLDERRELEPALQQILFDPNETPHGPTEIADIITSRVIAQGERVNAAFILKGKSFQQVKSNDIAHQVMKVRQLEDLGLMVLCAVGHIQDDAQRDFVTVARDANVDYLILDRLDTARLLIAYEKVCTQDGTPFDEEGRCAKGHELDQGIRLDVGVRQDYRYEVLKLQDVSHATAKRYSAVVLVDEHYSREVLREIVKEVTAELKNANYHRNEMVERRWSGTSAHVVWLFLAGAAEDVSNTNWLVRTQWIDAQLDRQWRPMEMKGDEKIDSISLKWNFMYDNMKEFHSVRTASKGEALRVLEPLIEEAISYGRQAANLLDEFGGCKVNQSKLEFELSNNLPDIQRIYDQSGDLPFPPADLKDYDEVCQELFADVHNIYFPFGELGRETWITPENRIRVSSSYVEMFEEHLRRWEFERQKIH